MTGASRRPPTQKIDKSAEWSAKCDQSSGGCHPADHIGHLAVKREAGRQSGEEQQALRLSQGLLSFDWDNLSQAAIFRKTAG